MQLPLEKVGIGKMNFLSHKTKMKVGVICTK